MINDDVAQIKRLANAMMRTVSLCQDQNQAICDVLVLVQSALEAVCKQQADIETAKTALTQAVARLEQIKSIP